MYHLLVLSQAVKDVQTSVDWYNEQLEGLGNRFLFEVSKAMKKAESNPLYYQERYSKKFRFVIVADFPFVIVFKLKGNLVVINAVFHTRRNPKKFK